MSEYSEVVQTAQDYYNSNDADLFYYAIWGGEDIHIGIYNAPDESIFDASRRTVEQIASQLNIKSTNSVLDIGAGYGGAARYLAGQFQCQVSCLNLSQVQNHRNRKLNEQQGLGAKIKVIDGNFEKIALDDATCDFVWSQDAILHSGKRRLVLEEVARVLKPGGEFIFTDPMQADDCPEGVLQPVLDRIHLDSMGSPGFYTAAAKSSGMKLLNFDEKTDQLIKHYTRVHEEINDKYNEIIKTCNQGYIDKMRVGLGHWIDAGKKGFLSWGILHFRKFI